MSRHEEGMVYYREIQKNGYLKRIPNDTQGGKLKNKKSPPKPMWTVFCIHNGRTPYLEQYPSPASPASFTHQPTWLSCLTDTKHVTAGLTHDFCLHTHDSLLTMRAEDWDTMQDWVLTLRNKLTELRILSGGENVYCPAPQPPPVRAGTRDPCSPLPPTPAGPRVRVPGIEIPTADPEPTQTEEQPEQTVSEEENIPEPSEGTWEHNLQSTNIQSTPSTSTNVEGPSRMAIEPNMAKICGQNICLDDSILRRNNEVDSETECDFTQRVVVGQETGDDVGEYSGTNVTVIQVSNKGPPHTAIPVIGETDVFTFDFDRPKDQSNSFVNIVNTEVNIQNENSYGSVFDNGSNYGHISLTTSVNLNNDSVYERLCLASTSKSNDVNVEVKESPYECLFPVPTSDVPTSIVTTSSIQNSVPVNVTTSTISSNSNKNINVNPNSPIPAPRNILNSNIQYSNSASGIPRNINGTINVAQCNVTSNPLQHSNSSTAIPRNVNVNIQNSNTPIPVNIPLQHSNNSTGIPRNINGPNSVPSSNSNGATSTSSNLRNGSSRTTNVRSNETSNSNIERSNSQNSDSGLRERFLRRNLNNKNEQKPAEPQKPIWKRGLTELNIITKIRGITLNRTDRDNLTLDNERPHQAKPVHRSRIDRVDHTRRRSSSLNNGTTSHNLQSLRQRQAATLRAEQATGASIVVRIPRNDLPILADASGCVWIAKWGRCGSLCSGRSGDRISAIRGVRPKDVKHALSLIKCTNSHMVDILFQRVPHGKIYILNKTTEHESIGVKLDTECQIVAVEPQSPAHNCGIPPAGQKWCITEVNNRQINLVKGGDEDMTRLSSCGTEVSILIQPATLVKKLRTAIKSNKTLLNIR